MSRTWIVSRAAKKAIPAQNSAIRKNAGMIRSQRSVGGSPLSITITHITHVIANSSSTFCSTDEIGSTARGKCSVRTSPRLATIDFAPSAKQPEKKANVKTPTTRNGRKCGGLLPGSRTPKTKPYTIALTSGVSTTQATPSRSASFCDRNRERASSRAKCRRCHSSRMYVISGGRPPNWIRPAAAAFRAAISAELGSWGIGNNRLLTVAPQLLCPPSRRAYRVSGMPADRSHPGHSFYEVATGL